MSNITTNTLNTLANSNKLANKQTKQPKITNRYGGFTIIELLIVIVIIGILVAITSIAYTGLTKQAKETSIKSDLKQAHTQLELDKAKDGTYPNNSDNLKTSKGNTFSYTGGGDSFCLLATNPSLDTSYAITQDGTITQGNCPIANGSYIQTVTSANCPESRTWVVDKRDNRTYYIQKINYTDGSSNCWMTTNLAYAGGGDNTYGDVKTIEQATSGTAYTEAKYYIPTGANPTTNPTPPSTSESGTGQYGYLYNWCAAMGNQQGTGACQNSTTSYDSNKSICPKNWRLPTGEATTGELTKLNNTVNQGKTNTDAGLIASPWLGQRSGNWDGSFNNQGSNGTYWSSTQNNAAVARYLGFTSTRVNPSYLTNKNYGFAVRCVAE